MEGSKLLDHDKGELFVPVEAPLFRPMLQFPTAKAVRETKPVGQGLQVKMEGLPWRMYQVTASAWRVFSVYTQSASRTALGRNVKTIFPPKKTRRGKRRGQRLRASRGRTASKGVADSVLVRDQHSRDMVGRVGV